MKFKVEDFTYEVKKDNTQNDSEQYFRKELEDYLSIPYLEGQPIYLVCPQYTYEVEIQADKIEELLANGTLKVNGIYETTEFGISQPKEEALPKIEEDFNEPKQALYLLDGINAYRTEVSLSLIDDCLKEGAITQFPNNNSDMMFQILKSTFQEYCQMNQIPYESWVNE